MLWNCMCRGLMCLCPHHDGGQAVPCHGRCPGLSAVYHGPGCKALRVPACAAAIGQHIMHGVDGSCGCMTACSHMRSIRYCSRPQTQCSAAWPTCRSAPHSRCASAAGIKRVRCAHARPFCPSAQAAAPVHPSGARGPHPPPPLTNWEHPTHPSRPASQPPHPLRLSAHGLPCRRRSTLMRHHIRTTTRSTTR